VDHEENLPFFSALSGPSGTERDGRFS